MKFIMLELIKYKIAKLIVERKLKKKHLRKASFSNFFDISFSFFVIMPQKQPDFNNAISVLDFLDVHNKTITVFICDYQIALLPFKYRNKSIGLNVFSDKNKLKLPTKNLTDRISILHFDVVLDLNIGEDLFSSYITTLLNSNYKVGFDKQNSHLFYNLILSVNSSDSKECYSELSTYLLMF